MPLPFNQRDVESSFISLTGNPQEILSHRVVDHETDMVSHLETHLTGANLCECRPCCPANFFLGPAIGTPSPPQTNAPACVLRLTGHGLRCLQRFHEKHGIDGMMFRSEARCCRVLRHSQLFFSSSNPCIDILQNDVFLLLSTWLRREEGSFLL